MVLPSFKKQIGMCEIFLRLPRTNNHPLNNSLITAWAAQTLLLACCVTRL